MTKLKISKFKLIFLLILFATFPAHFLSALTSSQEGKTDEQLRQMDSDNDGLSDYDEINIYHTDPNQPDTDHDDYLDGEEIKNNYDPNKAGDDRLQKVIGISLKDQTLTYSLGPYTLKTIKISSGLPRTPTPKGEFTILAKPPLLTYRGPGYFFPNTRWNMLFKRGSAGGFYIHGAYWHNNFGRPMSHGCVNVAYADMEGLYNWTDEGAKVTIE